MTVTPTMFDTPKSVYQSTNINHISDLLPFFSTGIK